MTDTSLEPGVFRRFFSPARSLALVVSGGALLLIARRLDRVDLLHQLKQMEPIWFLGALSAFLVSVSLSGWRWHQMLKVTGTAVNLRTSWRLTLIGHCFSALFFGAAVSDLAKATLYSRWFGFPVPRLLAASLLDRSTGALSTFLYATATLCYGLWVAPRLHWEGIGWLPLKKIGLVLLVGGCLLLGLVFFLRDSWIPFCRRFLTEVTRAVTALRAQARVALAAVLVGFLIQVMVSVILGCCLRAVCSTPIPWLDLLWTFPVIGLMASVPITISGAGAREGAAILLWTAFGITNATAFSASLLTLSVNLLWAGAGALLLWRGSLAQSSSES